MRWNICSCAVGGHGDAQRAKCSLPQRRLLETPAQIYMISAFVFCCLGMLWKPIRNTEHEHTKRNSIVCLGHLTFSTVALPFVLYELVVTFPAVANYDVVEQASWSVSRAFVTAQSVMYLVELFYRIDPRWEVILHHLITAALVIFLYYVADRTYAMIVLGGALKFYKIAVSSEKGTRTAFGGRLSAALLSSSGRDSSWRVASHSFGEWVDGSGTSEEAFIAIISIALVLLLWAQIFVGKVLLGLASKYEKLNLEQTQTKLKTRHGESSDGSLSRRKEELGMVLPELSSNSDDLGGEVLVEEVQ
eukprot:scaffold34620_cov160-Amphora_coffeaeformis.AAC.21